MLDVLFLHHRPLVRLLAHALGNDFGPRAQQHEYRVGRVLHDLLVEGTSQCSAVAVFASAPVAVVQGRVHGLFKVETHQVVVRVAVKGGMKVVVHHVALEHLLQPWAKGQQLLLLLYGELVARQAEVIVKGARRAKGALDPTDDGVGQGRLTGVFATYEDQFHVPFSRA